MAEALTQTLTVANAGNKAKAVASAVGSSIQAMAGPAQVAMMGEAISALNDIADSGQCGLAGMSGFGERPRQGARAAAGPAPWREARPLLRPSGRVVGNKSLPRAGFLAVPGRERLCGHAAEGGLWRPKRLPTPSPRRLF
jgi:hypothetical protein